MSDIMWSLPPNCSDRSLTAMEQALASRDASVSSCIRIPMSDGITSNPDSIDHWRDDDDVVLSLVSANVNPLAVTVFAGPPGSVGLNPRTRNVLLLTEIRDHEPWSGIIQRFDEVWVTPGAPLSMVSNLIPSSVMHLVIPTSIPPAPLASLDIPSGSPIVMLHEEWEDARGIESAIRAWLRNQDCRDGVLLVSIRSSHIDQSSALMTRIRMEEGCPKGRNRVCLMTSPSRKVLDACLLASDILICSHVEERGWRPLAIKAALSGKRIISTRRGDITGHLHDCWWVETPNLRSVTPDTMGVAMEGIVEGIGRGLSHSLSFDSKPAMVMGFPCPLAERMPTFLREAGERLVSPGS